MNLTQGEALVYHSFHAYEPFKGPIPGRALGVLVSSETGVAVPYALFGLRDRGPMFVAPGAAVYEGMIVGEHCKDNDLVVNLSREKKLTNVRSSTKESFVKIQPPRIFGVEEALEYVGEGEYVEITPANVRLRKVHLKETDRRREDRAATKAGSI